MHPKNYQRKCTLGGGSHFTERERENDRETEKDRDRER